MKISKRANKLEDSKTLSISSKAMKLKKDGFDIISFSIGQPDFETPLFIRDEMKKALDKGYTKYTAVPGIIELREAIAKKICEENNFKAEASEIVVSNGTKQSLDNVFGALIDEDDEVIIAKPYWVTYPELIRYYGGVPVIADTKEEDSFKFTEKNIREAITYKTKMILVNNPCNPVGSIYSKEELEMIGKIAIEKDLIILSDEIYEKLVYDNDKHISIASISEDIKNRTVTVNGFSKGYAMTGWRCGYSIAPKKVTDAIIKIQSHTTSSINTMTQYAAIAALEKGENFLSEMKKVFEKRNKLMTLFLDNIEGIKYIKPRGAFYIYVNIKSIIGKKYKNIIIENDCIFSEILLTDFNVAVVPGIAFGEEGYIRLSYANSENDIKKGIRLLSEFIVACT